MSDYSSNFPQQRPTLNLDFANSGKLDSRISFSRADTPPTYAAPSAVHYWSNEKSLNSENLLLQSQDFDTSPWSTHNLATTGGLTGGATAPDGTSTAWLLTSGVSTGSTNSPSVYMNLFGTSAGMVQPNSQNTYVMHVKSGTATHAWITVRGSSSNYIAAVLDFSNPSSLTTYQAGWTLDSYQLTALGNSWYRIALTFTSNSAVSAGQVYVGPTDSNTMTTYYPQWAYNGESLFAWGAQLSSTNSKVYDSPTTTQISREYSSTLKSVANAGDPRFEYDPASDGQSVAKGILVEGAATNLITYSNNFGSWSALRVTAEAGASVGPDGQSCYVMREDSTAADTHYLSLGASGQSTSTTYTMSVYAKKVATSNQTRHLRLRVNGIGGEASVEYNLANGTVNRTTGTSLDSSSISSIGNGWYRLVMTYTNPSGSVASGMIITGSPDTTATLPSYDGDGYSAFALFGAMVEAGSHASSLITSNSGSQTTRASDSCSVAVSEINYVGGPTTLLGDAVSGDTANYRGLLSVRVDNSNYISLYGNSAYNRVATTSADGVFSGIMLSGTGANGKVAARLDTNNFAAVQNGGAVTTDTSAPLPDLSSATIYIGSWSATSNHINGTIKRVALYNVALSDTELQALTS